MYLFRVKSLQQRLIFFLLLPVACLLVLVGLWGFIYARQVMLNQWREGAVLKLQRAAHNIDMRLKRPIEWIEMFHKTGGKRAEVALQNWVLGQLLELEGVTRVHIQWSDQGPERRTMRMMPGTHFHMGSQHIMHFHRGRITEVTPPAYDTQAGHETVSLVSIFKDESGKEVGNLEVAVRFDYLMEDIIKLGWWQSDKACLIDNSGIFLAHTEWMMNERGKLGETNDPLEQAILEAMREKTFGTLRGPGHPPDKVAGFYKMEQVPWTIVLFVPGRKILAPIVRFRFYYVLGGIFCIVVIVLLIRSVGGKAVKAVKEISQAAGNVARGDYGDPLPQKSQDEIGQLIGSFNAMVQGLKERDFISNTFGRYVDQDIAGELMRQPEATRLGGEKREVAILISDIRGFTPLSESLSPEGIISILNHYFTHMIEAIRQHKGIIVDFFGDGILVFFDPLDESIETTVHRAIRCAIEMQNGMEAFNAEMRKEDLPELEMGIGLNAGQVVVGNIGSEARAKYGIVGSAVNLTERIQKMAKGGEVVISDSIYRYSREHLNIKKSFDAELKGVQGRIALYQVGGFHDVSLIR
jgi:class 3 adenylate cyclase